MPIVQVHPLIGFKYLDFFRKAQKYYDFLLKNEINKKTIQKDSHFEMTKISKVFCGYYRFEMTIIFTAKSFPYDKKYDYHFES